MARKRSALARKGERIPRQVHGNAHVDRGYAEADDFLMMFHDVTDEFCWGTVWARPGLDRKTRALLHAYVYAGVYASLSSFLAAREAIREFEAERRARGTRHPRRARG